MPIKSYCYFTHSYSDFGTSLNTVSSFCNNCCFLLLLLLRHSLFICLFWMLILWMKMLSITRFTKAVRHWLGQAAASIITAFHTVAPVATVIFFPYSPSPCSVCRRQWNVGHYGYDYYTEGASMELLGLRCCRFAFVRSQIIIYMSFAFYDKVKYLSHLVPHLQACSSP